MKLTSELKAFDCCKSATSNIKQSRFIAVVLLVFEAQFDLIKRDNDKSGEVEISCVLPGAPTKTERPTPKNSTKKRNE